MPPESAAEKCAFCGNIFWKSSNPRILIRKIQEAFMNSHDRSSYIIFGTKSFTTISTSLFAQAFVIPPPMGIQSDKETEMECTNLTSVTLPSYLWTYTLGFLKFYFT